MSKHPLQVEVLREEAEVTFLQRRAFSKPWVQGAVLPEVPGKPFLWQPKLAAALLCPTSEPFEAIYWGRSHCDAHARCVCLSLWHVGSLCALLLWRDWQCRLGGKGCLGTIHLPGLCLPETREAYKGIRQWEGGQEAGRRGGLWTSPSQ